MNTYELERVIRDRVRRFDGVYSSDRLPKRPRLLVSNTDPSDEPGEHWVAIYVDDDGDYGEYFDSLGRRPRPVFERYMNSHCRDWTFNCRQLQSYASRFCGHYCVFYCMLRSIGLDMRRIVSCFTRDTGLNDVAVHDFVCGRMK